MAQSNPILYDTEANGCIFFWLSVMNTDHNKILFHIYFNDNKNFTQDHSYPCELLSFQFLRLTIKFLDKRFKN